LGNIFVMESESISEERRTISEVRTKLRSSSEIPSLDGWRATAIIIVFLSHAGLGRVIPGGFGVTIFFFLSGFLITSLMLAEREKSGTISIKKFYIRRLLRLSPPLLFTLALVYTLTYLGIFRGAATLRGLGAQIFYFANYYAIFFDSGNSTPVGTGIFWSLAVEEHFYLFFPWIFLYLAGTRVDGRLTLTLACACLAALAWRCALVLLFNAPENRTYYASDTRIDSIIFGVLLALNKKTSRGVNSTPTYSQWIVLLSCTALIAFSILYRSPVFRETFRYTIQGVALAPLFYYSIKCHNFGFYRILNLPAMKYIGRCSYAMYLIHFVLIENLGNVTQYATVNMAICFMISILYAAAIDKFLDAPFRAIRLRYR
jgi:peptidoglycan/LPS O-acetylase OafA/YrhL